MNEDQFKDLLIKYQNGKCTDREKTLIENWLTFGHFEGKVLSDKQMDVKVERLTERLGLAPKRVKLLPRIAAAASIVIAIGAGIFFYTTQNGNNSIKTAVYTGDVGPGKQGATLTLANGKKIRLSDAHNGELAKEAGVTITKAENGELVYQVKDDAGNAERFNTLTTAQGETYSVRLPDGSIVWLNSASSLTYAAGLMKDGKRSVKLEGEAFFDVAKDKLHPFLVQTRNQQVEVLGTQFNINSYREEEAEATTLLEGSVKISSGSSETLIKPGEQAVNQNGMVRVAEVNVENFVDWKAGDFNLDEMNFRVAMRKIARWYDVEVIFDKSVPEDIHSGGWISRNKKLSEVLQFIESSGIARFRIEGKKLYVSR
ncbi:FecR family protein [Pedobacter chinensis]|uniref:FecR family protein n=1 Tax=Pedobacter chinensis TaxID=2282421 RepID=A0A369PVK8_9SPHI|nr:FecR family protein [Pedobacter chinensis]RDC55265.1 FecR family protein [Pedobacter chinensis]